MIHIPAACGRLRAFWSAAACLAAVCLVLPSMQAQSSGQATQGGPSPQTGATPAAVPVSGAQSDSSARQGTVLFSRHVTDDGQTITTGRTVDSVATGSVISGPVVSGAAAAGATGNRAALPPLATDAERRAVAYTSFDLDVHLRPAQHYLAVRALLGIRNAGSVPLRHLPMQLSSTLAWQQIHIAGRDLSFTQSLINSDTDHTGQMNEATVTLPEPLAPGASLQVDVTYAGRIEQSAKRLLAIGTPDNVAASSDWDRITSGFTGLRGFGNVVWVPVSSAPAILGDGARVFDEIGRHKLQLTGAHLKLALTVETTAAESAAGQTPNIALVNGQPLPLSITQSSDPSIPSLAIGRLDDATLGFETINLFVASRTAHTLPETTLWATPASGPNVDAWSDADSAVLPFLREWLGQTPHSRLTILELPEAADIPFETGAMLATPVRAASSDVLDNIFAHALTHAWMMSRRAWLSEGVAHFMGTLWMEKQRGREQALAMLADSRQALALAEPASPGEGDGQPLLTATSPVYYRTKAAYVLWMLRSLVSDETLSAALRAYNPDADRTPDYFEHLLENAGQRRDLQWFFHDWVYHDQGLPDFALDNVYTTPTALNGSYLTAVSVSNNGYAGAEVSVQVISDLSTVTQRAVVPGRGKATLRILLQGQPTEVRVNDGTIPETDASIHVKQLKTVPVPASR